MKLRLFSIYEQHNAYLAVLTEYDYFAWAGKIEPTYTKWLDYFDLTYSECVRHSDSDNDAYNIMFNSAASIHPEESIHIIGDFDSAEELKEWMQMQYILDSITVQSVKTLIK